MRQLAEAENQLIFAIDKSVRVPLVFAAHFWQDVDLMQLPHRSAFRTWNT